LRAAGHRFTPGHRLRLSLASAHWPVIWPSPGAARLTVHRGPSAPSRLELLLAPAQAEQGAPPAFADPPTDLREFGAETSEPVTWEVVEDPLAATVTVRSREAATTTLPDGRSTLYLAEALQMTASERTPGEGRFENQCDYRLERDGVVVEVAADGTTVATGSAFEWRIGLRVALDGEPFFERRWQESIPRDLL
jgi:hypothetical protein